MKNKVNIEITSEGYCVTLMFKGKEYKQVWTTDSTGAHETVNEIKEIEDELTDDLLEGIEDSYLYDIMSALQHLK